MGLLRRTEVGLPDVVAHLLVRQRRLHGLLSVQPLGLQLSGEVLHVRLLGRREVGQRGLEPGVSPQLLHPEGGVLVGGGRLHPGSAICAVLLLRVGIGVLRARRLDLRQLVPEVALTFSRRQQLPCTAIGTLSGSGEVGRKLPFLGIADRGLLLDVGHLLRIGRHVLLRLSEPEGAGVVLHVVLQLWIIARLGRTHLRTLGVSSLDVPRTLHLVGEGHQPLHLLWCPHLPRILLGGLHLLRCPHLPGLVLLGGHVGWAAYLRGSIQPSLHLIGRRHAVVVQLRLTDLLGIDRLL